MISFRARKGTVKGQIGLLLKCLIAGAAVVALFYFRMIRLDALVPLFGHPGLLPITAVLFYSTLPLSAWRLRILLAVKGIILPCRQLYHICAIGAFSGTFMPGTIGGDALRFIYLAAAVPKQRAVIAVTLLSDRLLGVGGLVTVAVGAIALQWPRVAISPEMASLALSVFFGFAAALASASVLLIALNRLPVDSWRLHNRGAFLRLVRMVIDVTVLYRRARGTLIATFGLSVVIQICSVAALVLLAESMNLSAIMGPLQYALAGLLSNLVSAVPVTPGGLGVGEAAFQHFCQLLSDGSAAPFASAFFAFRGLMIAVLMVAIPSLIAHRIRRSA
jgi:glycosyltransferase 2 family protein